MEPNSILATMPPEIYSLNDVTPTLWINVLGRCMAATMLKIPPKDMEQIAGAFAAIALSLLKENSGGEYTLLFPYRGSSYDVRITGEKSGSCAPMKFPFKDEPGSRIYRSDVERWLAETSKVPLLDVTRMGETAYEFCSLYHIGHPNGHVLAMILYLMEIIDEHYHGDKFEYDVKDTYCLDDKNSGTFHISIKRIP